MKLTPTDLPGVLLIEPRVFGDERGCFFESYNQRAFAEAGLNPRFVQTNVSESICGVLRGLHYQQPNAQGKLVSVLDGEVYDVAVDIRRGSPHFGRWMAAILSAKNRRQLWIPEGFAHGFVTLSERAVFSYQCTALYDRSSDAGIRWNDARIGIDWPVAQPLLSDKDAIAPFLDDLLADPGRADRLPEYAS
ncbi:MAG: dTDP-4-dehydrorhamnose 3,5-epimerase [Proteobacteria bacterium]|nr:dTDP-4-dehydrorhamnose 3,5-epimerase [Pseudomonadota bacterium]